MLKSNLVSPLLRRLSRMLPLTLAIFLLCRLQPVLFASSLDVEPATQFVIETYTLRASGTVVGDFGWSVEHLRGFITMTTSFTSFLSTSSSAGCTISGVTINNPLSSDPLIETFFSPECLGFSEVAQTFFNAGPLNRLGVYVPEGVVSPAWTLTIGATVPEPSAVILLGMGFLGIALQRKRLHEAQKIQ